MKRIKVYPIVKDSKRLSHAAAMQLHLRLYHKLSKAAALNRHAVLQLEGKPRQLYEVTYEVKRVVKIKRI